MAAASPVLNTLKRFSDDQGLDHEAPSKRNSIYDRQELDEVLPLDVTINKHIPLSCYLPSDSYPPCCFEIMEVYSVIINGLSVDELYGDIYINGACPDVSVFHREKPSDAITIFTNNRGENELLISGPDHSIMMFSDWYYINMRFKNDVTKKAYRCSVPFGKRYEEDEDEYGYTFYDGLISATLSHEAIGSITMNFRVFEAALAAKVEVLLLDNNISVDDVYGEIYAYNSLHELESCLFYKDKKPDGAICGTTPPDNANRIPLARSIVALPHDANLVFALELTDSKTDVAIIRTYDLEFTVPSVFLDPNTSVTPLTRILQRVDVSEQIQINIIWASRFDPNFKDTVTVLRGTD